MPERLHPYADFFAKVMDKFDKIIDTIARKNIVVLLSIASKMRRKFSKRVCCVSRYRQ